MLTHKEQGSPSILPDSLVTEMRRLHECGFTLLPLGGGEDGKSALCTYTDRKPSFRQTLGLMKSRRSLMYGIRLDGLLVVDADEMTPDTEDAIITQFGGSTVQVATPRGRHFWYRDQENVQLASLSVEGYAGDLKRGPNQYVVGPGSVRPDGGEYVAVTGRLGSTVLGVVRSPRVRSSVKADLVPIGQRHNFLRKKAREYAETAMSPQEIEQNLFYDRDRRCEVGDDPMPDAELCDLATWGWGLRLKPGGLFRGRRSQVSIKREVMDYLLARPNGVEAFALYSVLLSNHGHITGKRFAVDFEGMKGACLIQFGRDRFRHAKQMLVDCGLIKAIGSYVPGKQCQQYQLGRLATGDGDAMPSLAP